MDADESVRQAYEAYYRRLVTQVSGLVGDLAEAEDAVHEAFARVLASPRSFLRADDPERWLRVVVLNVAPAIALFLTAVATRRPTGLVRLLSCRPLQALGDFSYSLYLIHMPIVALISTLIVVPYAESRLAAFPICLITARLFAAVFETPFRHRSSTDSPA